MTKRKSTINIRETGKSKTVEISSVTKPEIISSVIFKWQLLLDTVANIVSVPSGLIMKLNEDTIEVFLKSETEGNPYEVGGKERLIYGLYCENVIGQQQRLLVPDATKSNVWKDNNPDIDINMISYLGLPINWPDGEVFGTVCLLDNKENHYNENYSELLNQSKHHIETDLKLLASKQELKDANKELEKLNGIKSRFLSLITHDVRGGISTIDQFIKLTLDNFNEYDKDGLKKNLELLSQTASSSYLMLEDLLNWSKNDLIEIIPDKKQVNLVKLLENLLVYFNQAIILKEIELTKDFESDEIHIFSDENMIKASLRNILSNAIKYTKNKGKILVKVSTIDEKKVLVIKDTGLGMNKESLVNLFNREKKHSNEGTQGESSAGIGMLIAKGFLDKNGAQIKIESEPGIGTKVIITI